MAPVFQAVGAQQNSTGASVNVAWPTHLADDIGLVVIETSGNSATLTPPTGWVALPSTPVTDVATIAGSKLHVWWKRAASSAEAAIATGAATDHIVARLFTFRGCVTTGNPWDVTTTGTKTTASTTATVPALVTTVNDTLITMIVGRPNDNASTAHFDVPVNAGLTSLNEAGEAGTTSGNGGGFVVSYGIEATAGNTGTSTLTKIASTTDTYVVLALKAPVAPLELIVNAGTFTLSGTTTGLLETSTIVGTTSTFSLVGNDIDFAKSVSLDASVGTFTLDGTSKSLLLEQSLIPQTEAFTLAGSDLVLTQNAVLGVNNGQFIVAGQNTEFNLQSVLTNNTATFSLVGNEVILQQELRIDATTSTYNVADVNTQLILNRQLVSQAGTFSIAGVDVTLQYTPNATVFALDVVVGAYSLSGEALLLNRQVSLNNQPENFALAGNQLGFVRTLTLENALGTFSLFGTTLTLNKQVSLINQTGTFTVVGNQLGFIRALALHSAPGTFSVAGKDSIFSLTRSFNLTTGTYSVGYVNSNISRLYQINGQVGTYQLNTSDLDYFSTRRLEALSTNLIADFRAVGNFFWYQTTQTIQPVKYKITKRNEWILGRATHMGRRGL